MNQSIDKPLLLNQSIKEDPPLQSQLHINPSVVSQPGNYKRSVQPHRESLVSDLSEGQKKSKRKFKIIQIISGVCFILAIVIAFAFPPLLHTIIVQKAIDESILTPSTQGRWAHFPGQTQTIITRNLTFFKLLNQWDHVFNHAKPKYRQISGYKIQQLQDFLNITYLEDGNKVKFVEWVRFSQFMGSKSLDEKVNILNMGNLGYWSTFKNARPTLVLQQGLALLFTSLEQSLIPTLLGSGLNQQFITNSSSLFSKLLSPAGIPIENTNFLWNDPVYGFYDKENLGTWAIAAINCFQNDQNSFIFSQDANILKNHFALSDYQIKSLMTKIYSYVTNLRKILLENHYCAEIDMSQCTGRYLGVAQLADSWVTGNTPPVATTSPNDTICDDNITCKGKYPELYAFYKNIFSLDEGLRQKFDLGLEEGHKFDRKTVLNWFNYNHSIQEGLDYNTAQNCLLHIGNLDALWQIGTKFQQNFEINELQPMMIRFGLTSIKETLVFWFWIRYLHKEFITQNAAKAHLGMSNLFTSGLYQQFSYLKDNLQRFLLAKKLKHDLSKIQCHYFFERSLDENNMTLIDNLCHQFGEIDTDDFAFTMVDACQNKTGVQWSKLKALGVSLVSLQNLCDISTPNNVGSKLHQYKISFDTKYNCSITANPYCSNFELALIQWKDSSVTLNVPFPLQYDGIQPSYTFNSWDDKSQKIEYGYFISQFDEETQKKFPRYSLEQLYKNFNFEGWFSTNGMLAKLKDGYFGEEFYQYIRYVCIYVSLGGYTATHTVRQYLFGYYDTFLEGVRTQYPPFGGDPSAPSFIHFNQLNLTSKEASDVFVVKTGKDDYKNLNQFYQINGQRYLTNLYSSFNGNTTIKEWKSPWAQKDYFYGTNAKIFPPNQFQSDNLSILISQLQRYGGNYFNNQTQKTQRYGQEVYLSLLNKELGEVAPHNDKYYQTIASAFNSTSIYGFPLFITNNHFRNCTQYLKKVDIYIGESEEIYTETSHYDQNFILVEPYTGASFQSFIFLQNNYYHQKDELYDYPEPTFLPIFSIARSGNLTEAKYHELFDPLVTGLMFQSSLLYVGIGLGVLVLGFFVYATIKKRRIQASEPMSKDSQIGISLQEQNHLNKSVTQQAEKGDD